MYEKRETQTELFLKCDCVASSLNAMQEADELLRWASREGSEHDGEKKEKKTRPQHMHVPQCTSTHATVFIKKK